MKPKRLIAPFSAITSFVLAFSMAQSIHAEEIAWNGNTSSDWATGTNWDGNVAPANDLVTDIAVFSLGTYTNSPNTGITSVGGIRIGDGSTTTASLLVTGSALTIGSNGISVLAEAGDASFFAPIAIGAAQSWSNSSANQLYIDSISSRFTGATVSFTLGSGGISAPLTDTNGIIGGWAVINNGATYDWAHNDGAAIAAAVPATLGTSFSGDFSAINWTNTDGNTTLTDATQVHSYVGASDITISGTLTIGSGGMILGNNGSRWIMNGTSGSITTGQASGELFVHTPNTGANDMRIRVPIVDNGGTPTILVKGGAGRLDLEAENTYSGTTILNQGNLFLRNGNALSGSSGLVINGNIGFVCSTNLTFSGPITGSGTLNNGAITGNASLSLNGDLSGFTGTLAHFTSNGNNNFNLGGGTAASMNASQAKLVTSGSTTQARNVNINGTGDPVFKLGDLSGTGGKINANNGTTLQVGALDLDSTFAGNISSNGGLEKVGAGTLTLSGANSYTGTTTVTGGTLEIGDGSSGSIAAGSTVTVGASGTLALNLANGGTFTNAITNDGVVSAVSDNPMTLSSAIGGTGSLQKSGLGTLTLSGTNTYSGITTVTDGTLLLGGGTLSSPLTITQGALDGTGTITTAVVADSASNTVSAGNGSAGSLTFGTLTFQGAATLNFRAAVDVSDQFINTTDLNTSASGPITVNVTNTASAWDSGVDYPLINYSGAFNGDISHFSLVTPANLNSNQTAELVDTGSAIVLRVTGESLVWTGTNGPNWNTSDSNWSFESNPTSFGVNDPVLFDNTAAEFGVILTENVSPSAIEFDNDTPNDYTLSGAFGITSGSLIKNGTGKLTISTLNSYTGTTTINAGVLEINGTGTIASSSSILNNGSLILNLTGSHTYENPITGTGSVTKQGAGTLTLSGANTFAGDFTLDAGALEINSPGALGSLPGTIVINGGTIDNTTEGILTLSADKPQTWNSDIAFAGTQSLNMANGAVTLTGSRTVNVAANTLYVGAVGDAEFSYNLVKTGAGKLILNGGNIAGNLDIQDGILGLNQDFHGAAAIGTGILENAGDVGTKWTFWYGPNDVTSNVLIRNNDGSNTRQLGIIKRGSGTLTLTNDSNIATGNLSVDSGKLVLSNTGTYGAETEAEGTVTNLTANVGSVEAANGVLEIHGATVDFNNRSATQTDVWRSTLNVGSNGTGAGALKLSSGSLTTNKQLALASTGGAFGAMTQTDGTTNVGGFLALGLGASQGVLNLTGGTFNQAGPVTNGAGGGSTGVINLGGTAAYNQTSTGDAGLWVGEAGTGVLNVSGNATLEIVAANNGLQLGRNASGVGTANLNGGTVTVQKVYKGSGSGTVNFDGGTLTANVDSGAFLSGLTAAYVNDGGGTIDNGGFAVTIDQALLAPTGGGVSATGLTVSGGGCIDTPIVTITGDGTGATAVANIDASGNLTGITITNPGVGYTTASFALSGGGIGNTAAIGGAPTIVTNTSGGMTFTGAGTTTLTGTSTYTGDTTVEAGVLAVDGDALDDGSTLVINGGKIDPMGATEVVSSLFFGATEQATGTWGATGSGADHIDDAHFTGTGVVSVVPAPAAGFSSWADANASGQTMDQDHDNDGVDNGIEYFMGLSGSSFTANPAPVNGTITWPMGAAYAGVYGTDYEVQTSPDLAIWTPVAEGSVTVTTGVSLAYTLPTGGGKLFVRLVVKN